MPRTARAAAKAPNRHTRAGRCMSVCPLILLVDRCLNMFECQKEQKCAYISIFVFACLRVGVCVGVCLRVWLCKCLCVCVSLPNEAFMSYAILIYITYRWHYLHLADIPSTAWASALRTTYLGSKPPSNWSHFRFLKFQGANLCGFTGRFTAKNVSTLHGTRSSTSFLVSFGFDAQIQTLGKCKCGKARKMLANWQLLHL